MKIQVQLDSLIKKSLADKSETVHIPDNMATRVQEKINCNMKNGLFQKIITRTQIYGLQWKKVVATIIICVLATTAILGFNPQVRAWAEKTANFVTKNISITFSQDGSSYTKSIEKIIILDDEEIVVGIEEHSYITSTPTTDTKDMNRLAGFNVKLPQYLPIGYKIPNKISVFNCSFQSETNLSSDMPAETLDLLLREWDPSKQQSLVTIKLNDSKSKAKDSCMLTVSNNNFLGLNVDQGEPTGTSNDSVTLYINKVTINAEQGEQQKLPGHILQWKDDGIFYKLEDYSGLSVDELKKIVESIIADQ